MAKMNFAVLRRPRTQALLDQAIRIAGFSIRWHPLSDPLGWELRPQEGRRDLASAAMDGGEMSISSFVQAKARGAPLVALPIFLKRGLVQRSFFCPVESLLGSPEELIGKRVGLVSFTSSMAVWSRTLLQDGYGVDASRVQWYSLADASHAARPLSIPEDFAGEPVQAWEELDGYPHELDRRESFLLAALDRRRLDAVVSFQARIQCEKLRPLLREESLWSHPLSAKIYPINHLFVMKTAVVREFPAITESLLSAFREARRLWQRYQPRGEREAFEKEMARLGYDPFAYRFGEVEKTTLETLTGFMRRESLISRNPGLDELIYGGP